MNFRAPQFIVHQALLGHRMGRLSAYCIHVDLVGFSSFTDRITKTQLKGVESISSIIEGLFGPIFTRVHLLGGIVASFGGDSLTILVEDEPDAWDKTQDLARFTLGLRETYRNLSLVPEKLKIDLRIGIAKGNVDWAILDGHESHHFAFVGSPILDSIQITRQGTNQVYCHPSTDQKNISKNGGNIDFRLMEPTSIAQSPLFPMTIIVPEIKNVATLFISLPETSGIEHVVQFHNQVKLIKEKYGVSLLHIDPCEKGINFILSVGVDKSFQDDIDRAFQFALELRTLSKIPSKTAVSFGTSYVGSIGGKHHKFWSIIGPKVNLAARMAQANKPGEIIVTKNALEQSSYSYKTENNSNHYYKGLRQPVETCILVDKDNQYELFSDDEIFVGRVADLQKLNQYLSSPAKSVEAIAITGEAGIGKKVLSGKL